MAFQRLKDLGLRVALAGALLASFLSTSAQAQVIGATLSGTVTDTSGGAVAGAKVSIGNKGTGETRTVNTDANGFYASNNLQPGAYSITVSATGFATQERTGITLTVGAQQVLNLSLRVGNVSERVEVTGESPAVDLASSTLTNTVEGGTIRELPLNGRDWTQLATLEPGVTGVTSIQPSSSTGYTRGNRGYGSQLSISGARPQQNNYRLDGISVDDYANGGPGSVTGASLGVDAIQEFSVLTSNYSAEYGRTSGGVVNAISRSGTNEFHGDAFEFLRNDALDARNFFDTVKPPFRRNQFGAAAGGPIRKEKTFIFGDYEGTRQSLGITNKDRVPSQAARDRAVPSIVPFLALWHPPNGAITGDTGIFNVAIQQVTTENFVTARGDQVISAKDAIHGTYLYNKGLASQPDRLDDSIIGNTTQRHFISLEETHTFSPSVTNSVRVGFNRVVALNSYGVQAINPAANDKALGAIPGQNAPIINVPSITTLDFGGLNSNSQYRFHWNSFQGYDDAFFTSGKHTLKFGAGVERMQLNYFTLLSPGGNFSFSSLDNFLSNQPLFFQGGLPTARYPRSYRQTIAGAYVQDDFRWRPSVTLNLGLRYEMSTVPGEVNGRLTGLPSITAAQTHLGGPLFSNPTLRNFEPRIGFAWDPFKSGKTSVRGGFGFFDVLPLWYEYSTAEISGAPFTLQGKATGLQSGDFPTNALNKIKVAAHLRTPYIEPDPRRNYVMQWNFNVQRQIAPSVSVMAAYIGSRGVHQPYHADDINIVLPTLTPQGYVWPCGGPIVAGFCTNPSTGTTLNPNSGRMDTIMWSANSFYHALQLQVEKKMSHGFQVRGSYTWGKAIDESSASGAGDPFQNSISSLFWFDRSLRRSLSDFNTTHNVLISYTWMLPEAKSLPGAVKWVLGGWQLGGIFQARTGLPFTPILAGDPLGLNSADPYAYPDRLGGPGCGSAVNPGNADNYIKTECFSYPNPSTRLGSSGRNSLIGPGLTDFDFSAFKNTRIRRISETFNAQLRVEFFNVFNHANFNSPINNSTIFDETGNLVGGVGQLDSTSTTAREIQFGLKIIW